MNVVWVTALYPRAVGGAGHVLEYELVRLITRRHNVHIISGELRLGQDCPDLDCLGVTYEGASWTLSRGARSHLDTLWILATQDAGTTFFLHGDRIRAITELLERYESTHAVDLVQVVYGEMAPVLRAARAPTGLLLFDVYTRIARREFAYARRVRDRVRWAAQTLKLSRWEKRWYPNADAIASNSRVDAEVLRSMIKRPVEVIPNPISTAFFDAPSVPRSETLVTFVATLDYRPNIDAVKWLASDIWPAVLKSRPDAKLRFVGRRPSAEVWAAAKRLGATVHPDVPDVRPFYWETAVALAPIRLGAGLRNKILHAMACGAPVVATPTALEGHDAVAGEHVLLADDAQTFANAVVSVLNDRDGADARAERAKSLVRRYDVALVAHAIEHWWERISAAQAGEGSGSSSTR